MGLKKIKLIGAANPHFDAELEKLLSSPEAKAFRLSAWETGVRFREAFKKAAEDEKCV